MKSKQEIQSDIEAIRDIPGVPRWMLDINNYAMDKPLNEEELFEFAEFNTSQMRRTAALLYLNDCADRFGFNGAGNRIFCAPGLVVEIDEDVIETLLIHQIEKGLMQERPDEKYITPMRFYMLEQQDRKETGSTWLIDFIDHVFIEGAKELEDVFDDSDNIMH